MSGRIFVCYGQFKILCAIIIKNINGRLFKMGKNPSVLIINGSPNPNGNTTIALKEMEKIFSENGVDVETV